ncbi:MAG: hypothetical protein V2G47_02680 [bacterium JZ-2024 1]
MSQQANPIIANLDIRCAELGRELADIEGMDEKVLNEALAVLEEQGIYAMFLYILARHERIAGQFTNHCAGLLKKVFGEELPEDALEAAKQLADNVDNLLFARDLLRNALSYARYHLKAKGG